MIYNFLRKNNLKVVGRRLAAPGESFIAHDDTPVVWTNHYDCYGPRLIVEKRS